VSVSSIPSARLRAAHGGIFRGSSPQAQDRFSPILADAQRNYHVRAFKWRGIDQQRAERHLLQTPLHQLLQLCATGFNEVLADRALLPPVGFRELAHSLAVAAPTQSPHQLLPHGFR
jgi:hypothetical protein